MAEYIERDALLKFIENGLNNPDRAKAFGYDVVEIMAEVRYAPDADVAPVVHGKWVGFYNDTCSECDWAVSSNLDFNCGWDYGRFAKGLNCCPNCGARMDGE